MKKALFALATTAMLALGSVGANATPITVGGVTWDPDSFDAGTNLDDFTASGSVRENSVNPSLGITSVTGFGRVTSLNSVDPNAASFCVGCELTYYFTMDLVSIGPGATTFSFNNVKAWLMVDNTPDFSNTLASAKDGEIWLQLVGSGELTGTGTNIGTGSDSGSGNVLLNVVGGLAMENFDTNTFLGGADMRFNSEFRPLKDNPGMLTGTSSLDGNSIPEPASLALVGLGLLGVAAARRRKQAK